MGTSLTNSHRGQTDALCHRLMEPGVSAGTVQGGTSSLPMPLVLEDTDCQQGSPEETVQAHSRMSSVRFQDQQCFQKQKGGGEASRAGQEGSEEPAGLSTPRLRPDPQHHELWPLAVPRAQGYVCPLLRLYRALGVAPEHSSLPPALFRDQQTPCGGPRVAGDLCCAGCLGQLAL